MKHLPRRFHFCAVSALCGNLCNPVTLPWNQLSDFSTWESYKALLQYESNLETLCVTIWDPDEDADESVSYPEGTLPRLRVVESKRVPSTFLDSANLPALMSITGIYSNAIPSLCSVIRQSNCTLTHLSLSFAKDTADLIRLLRLCFSLTSLHITELLVEESEQVFFDAMAQSSYIVPLLKDLNIYVATCLFECVTQMVEMLIARQTYLKVSSIRFDMGMDGYTEDEEWMDSTEKTRLQELY